MVVNAHQRPSLLLLSLCLLVAAAPPSDQVYMQAAAVFRRLQPEKAAKQQQLHYGEKRDEAHSTDESVQRRAYQLAFSTLTCTSATVKKNNKLLLGTE